METPAITNALRELGFQDTEAKIYLALLQNGRCTVSDIARHAGLKRPTVYEHIGGLSERDLIRKTVKGKRVLYYPEDPKKILRLAEHARKRAEEIFPQLQTMFAKSSAKPVVRFYEGKESIRSVYRELTSTHKTVWSVFAAERYFRLFTEKDGREFLENIRKNGGELRDLVLHSPDGVAYVKQKWGAPVAKSKLLPRDFAFDVDIMIAGDKLAFVSFENMLAVVIENKPIADLQAQFFRFIWKNIGS